MSSILEGFFGFLMNEEVPFIMCGLIFLWALYNWGLLAQQLAGPIQSLQLAISLLRNTRGPDGFVERYEEVSDAIGSDPVLGHSWLEFKDTLITPEEQGERVRNTARPELYFNQAILTKADVNMRFFDALPNYLVGVGLLFTFLGLVAALFFASQGVGAAVDVAILKLKSLLDAATFKFATSIAGLFASIVFSIIKSRKLRRFHKLLDEFCALLESRMDFASSVRISDDSKRELKKQTGELQRFNTDLAISIAEALDQRMESTFSKALAPLTEQLKELTKGIGSANEDALKKIAEDFSQNLSGAAGKEISALSAGLEKVGATLTSVVSGLGTAGEDMQREITASGTAIAKQFGEVGDEMARKLADAGEAFVGKIAGTVDSLAVAVQTLPEKMKLIESGLTDADAALRSSSERLQSVLGEVSSAIVQLKSVTLDIVKVAEPLGGAADKLAQSASSLASATEQITAANASSEKLAQILNDYISNSQSLVTAQDERFGSLDQTLANVFRELEAGLEKYRQSVERFVSELDRDMAKAVDKFSNTVGELGEVLEDAVDTLKPTGPKK